MGDIDALASKIYADMVSDLVQELSFIAVKSMKRASQPCSVCHTHCQTDHGSAPSGSKVKPTSPSKLPLAEVVSGAGQKGGGSGPAGQQQAKTDVMLSCLNCSRPIASSRYAYHLTGCMGVGNSRRGAARNTAQRLAQEAEAGSPYVESDSGGEGSKSKSKSADDSFRLDPKSKKRPLDANPKLGSKKQKVSPTKSAIPAHLIASTAPGARPQPKGTGPPRRPAALLPLPGKGPALGAPIAPPISMSSTSAQRPTPPYRTASFPPRPPPPTNGSASSPAIPEKPLPMAPPKPGPGTYLDQYTGNHSSSWLQLQKAAVPDSPPHADADEIVDTDSSDDDS